jgi:RNA polymerase sigma factor (sigma-70 family)
MSTSQPLHALLDQTVWIHTLARQLVADPHLAADLAQDATVAALERAPDEGRPLRGWLATVMRNQLAKLRRGEASRTAREREVRGAEAAPGALDVVEKAETHRNVVLAVLALEEPYKSTLLMRFFEQLSYDEIARRTGMTSAAVNSRITRGLAELRLRLETTYGGDRRALGLALLPLAKLPTGLAATTTTTFLGLKTMHILIGTAAATLVTATVSLGVFSGGREPAQPAQPSTSSALAPASEGVELTAPFFEPTAERSAPAELVLPQDQRERRVHEAADDTNTWRTELSDVFALAPTVESLSVSTGAGDVQVLPSNGGRLEIQATVKARTDKVKREQLTQVFADHVEVVEEDGVLRIEDNHKNTNGWTIDLVVYVPARLPLSANSGAGDVLVRTGSAEVNANSGAGDVLVELPGERVKRLRANSGAGQVRAEVASVEESLSGNSGAGAVALLVLDPSSPGKVTLNSGAGSVSLMVPANIVGSFDLETFGSLQLAPSLGLRVSQDVSGQSRAAGTLGSGGGSYSLRSGAGNLAIGIGNQLPPRSERRGPGVDDEHEKKHR